MATYKNEGAPSIPFYYLQGKWEGIKYLGAMYELHNFPAVYIKCLYSASFSGVEFLFL